MTVPKPPPFDASAANNAWRSLKKADGSSYSVFLNTAYPDFVKWVRGQRDHLEALRLGVFGPGGVKADLDALRGSTDHRLDILEAKVAALEAAPPSPFPG